MTVQYASHFSTRQTPQSQPVPGKPMVANSAGGFAFPVDDWTRLDRFLILGNEGGSYYATEKALTIENARAVERCWAADPARTASRIAEISEAGRAPKNDPALFALAVGSKRPEALAVLPRVVRTGTHLFQFAEMAQAFRGWGRGLRRAVANWYLSKQPRDLAYQVTKYQQRNGWSHRDLLRLTHPKAEGVLDTIFRWAVGKQPEENLMGVDPLVPIVAFERAKQATDKREVVRLIREYDLVRECVPTQFLTEPEVWEALLEKMPLTAMVRNLATMTRVGLLAPMSAGTGRVLAELANAERLRKSRLHPVAVLAALLTYKQGHGERGKHTWNPVAQIVDALDGAFYSAFGNVESTGKRWYLGIDVSGSMWSGSIAGVPGLTPGVGAGAMALVTAATEPQHCIAAFNTQMVPVALSPRQRLDDACNVLRRTPWGGTDCAQPMLDAMARRIPVDVFVVLTDSETWHGNIHPAQALEMYRNKTGIPAKMIVVGMVSNGFTISDPNDGGSLDVVGFDTAVPNLMADFVRGS